MIIDFVDIARRSSARGLQLHYTASRGFVSDSWAFLLVTTTSIVIKLSRCFAHGLYASACKISPLYDMAFRRR